MALTPGQIFASCGTIGSRYLKLRQYQRNEKQLFHLHFASSIRQNSAFFTIVIFAPVSSMPTEEHELFNKHEINADIMSFAKL